MAKSQPPPPQRATVLTPQIPQPKTTPLRMHCEMQVAADGPFELPDDWVVEIRPRGNSSSQISDKYYHEPYTGRIFRSLASVKRYLNREEEPTPRPKTEKIHQPTSVSSMLPDGWIEEHVLRKHGPRIDRYFIEPGTGRKFRSLPEVQRYLTVNRRIRPKLKPLQLTYPMMNSAPRKKARSISSSFSPPEKVNWVLSTSERGEWTPFVDESEISSHAKEQWRDAFFLGMTTRNQQILQITMGSSDPE